MTMKNALESISTLLPATADQRPLEHSTNGIPWSCEITYPRKPTV